MKRYLASTFICLLFVLWSQEASAQQSMATVHGTLQNRNGNPIAGATIKLVESPDIQTVSNSRGRFTIMGEQGQHLRIKGSTKQAEMVPILQDTMKIRLNNGQSIPVGFGLIRSQDAITSAVGIVRAKDLPSGSSINSSGNLLIGKVPGLTVLQTTNLPNNRYSPVQPIFYIRGRGTFQNSSPLVIVDGFPRPINSVVPEAIKSVSVLKDAAAQAMYGQRGANGVIVVKTKRGRTHGLKVHASYNQAITQPIKFDPNLVGASGYSRAVNEARSNDGRSPKYSQYDVHGFDAGNSPYFYPDVDWFNEIFRDHGTRTNFNIDFDGGGSSTRYFILLHYMHDNGILGPVNTSNDYSTQYRTGQVNLRTNLDIDLTSSTLLKLNVWGRLSDLTKPESMGSVVSNPYFVPSAAFPIKTPDGNWGGSQSYGSYPNPVAALEDRGNNSPSLREFVVDGKLTQDLDSWLEGLSVEGDAYYHNYGTYFEQHTKTYQYEAISPERNVSGAIIDTSKSIYGTDTDLSYYSSFVHQIRQGGFAVKLHYNQDFGNNGLKALLFVEQNSITREGFNDVLHRRNIAGNLHYSFNKTYFVDVAASFSGKNYLPEGDRYHFFPAVSAAWLLSNEDFMQGASFLDRLKLRASWGVSGNDQVPMNDPYKTKYSFGGGPYGFRYRSTNNIGSGYHESRLPSSDFTIERSNQTNVGIDARLFGHLNLTADLFYAHRTNILTGSDGIYSEVVGIGTPLRSNGVVNNKGLDGSLKWKDTIGKVAWHIGGQISLTHNKIVNMNEQYQPYPYLKKTGREIGQSFGMQAIGFFKDEKDIANSPTHEFSNVKPGDVKYKDQNDDGVVNQLDEVPIGYHGGYPDIYYSASVGFQYKGFSLSALFQGTGRMTAYLNTESVYKPLVNNTTISSYYYNRRWTPQTAGSATLPRLTTESNDNNFRPNSIWLVDQSYLKLRNLKLSYTLPIPLVQKLNMDMIKITAQGRNLVSFDHIPVGDPEHFGTGYPMLRSYSLGINIAF